MCSFAPVVAYSPLAAVLKGALKNSLLLEVALVARKPDLLRLLLSACADSYLAYLQISLTSVFRYGPVRTACIDIRCKRCVNSRRSVKTIPRPY